MGTGHTDEQTTTGEWLHCLRWPTCYYRWVWCGYFPQWTATHI